MVGVHPSRPATSYEANGYMPPSQGFNSRVEEAALLLNFQSGGWPNHAPGLNAHPVPVSRPHANSFPQDAYHARPVETLLPPQPALLPPFNPQDAYQPPPMLPCPPGAMPDIGLAPVVRDTHADVEMPDAYPQVLTQIEKSEAQPHMFLENEESRAASSENTSSEISEAPKGRRGWPKGKPRGSGTKKSMGEKAASKRASRKKTPDTRASRAKSEGVTTTASDASEVRRKSLSDVLIFGEQQHADNVVAASSRSRSVPREIPMQVRESSPSKSLRRKATVHPDTICAGCQTSRESNKLHSEFDEWISCNGCKKWYHIDCAGFKKAHDVRDVDKYFCTACEPKHGKTTYVRKSTRAHASVDYAELQRGVLKTSEESVEHHYIQPIKDGTFQFDPETFPRMRPEMITKDFFEKSGTFTEPICIPAEWNPRPWAKRKERNAESGASTELGGDDERPEEIFPNDWEYDTVPDHGQDGLDMVMPEGLTVRQVCNLVGADTPIDVIDVKTQNSGAKWNLSRWADYYEEESDAKAIRNVISLEVSQTKLGRLLQRPKVVRDIDLQDDVWPQHEIDKGRYPKVQFYCLMSVADSYTDFHIDFGGSSVYYHILKGKKTFFFIPPKVKYLKAYEEWNDSPQQNYTFLPSITKECYRVDLSEGDTMLIPSGWIHAVWTPEDSLVIGGNFLNRLSYKNQFKVVEIEKANETPMKFRYPFFQKIMWYAAIKYLDTDPLPDAVRQLFYEGKQFYRAAPIWADFDGDIAQNDPRVGAHNARFYSQAEMDGLTDLMNYIFRTVMLVAGRIEGVTADRMKRVNASIPKGFGEPLDLAKTFALWVAWKRGNEDPPAWAHPDAVLPSSKEEGPPKKLSERKLKDLERKEAIAAWRVAPDRQSARVMTKNASAAAAAASNATETSNNSSPIPAHQQNHQFATPYYQNHQFAQSHPSQTAPPGAMMMPGAPGQYLSTPKTSVLGPKRVACDACRKRRIRCKHKDMVMQTSPNSIAQINGGVVAFQAQPVLELHDNITVTPTRQGFMSTVMDTQQPASYPQPNGNLPHAEEYANGAQHPNGTDLVPGTNAYVSANIPMTINGVPMFGDVPKRGRSKACYECRKSKVRMTRVCVGKSRVLTWTKRRCIHDENGNVDPVKASETPVPRGSVSTKKRSFGEEGSPDTPAKKPKIKGELFQPYSQIQLSPNPQNHGQGVLKPQPISKAPSNRPRASPSANRQRIEPQPANQPEQVRHPQIDPSLFSLYHQPDENAGYDHANYSYQTGEQPQPNGLPSAPYQLPSLEQIANEVLVDLSGNDNQEQELKSKLLEFNQFVNAAQSRDTAPMPNGDAKPDESVDSAVSLPNTEKLEQNGVYSAESSVQPRVDEQAASEPLPNGVPAKQEAPAAHPSIETDAFIVRRPAEKPSPSAIEQLPLYQPPAPPSKSPETVKRQPNGISHGNSMSPEAATSTSLKRKRNSTSATPGSTSAKKAKVESGEVRRSREPSVPLTEEEKQSLELARMLQQEDLGLRRRSK